MVFENKNIYATESKINIANLTTGNYFILIESDANKYLEKIIVE